MTYGVVAARARENAAWCVSLLGLAIPLSTAFDSIVTGAIFLAWLIALPIGFSQWRASLVSTPPFLVAALLFALLLAGCFYGTSPWKVAWASLSKYLDLLLVSVLAWAVSAQSTRRRALSLFLGAVVLNLVVSYAAANGFIEWIPGLHTQPHYPVGFKLSVTHNILVSLGAFVCLALAREVTTTAARAALIGLALLCIHNVLFIVTGRTGYVVLAALLAYFAFTTLRGWRSVVLTLGLVVGLFAAAYYGSGLQERAREVVSDLTRFEPGAGDETSVGQRIGYYRTTLQIIAEHPFGVGTGGFARAYAEKVKGTAAPATSNPHNDYLMIGAQTGLPGLTLLIAMYAVIWRTARNLSSRLERDLARAIVLTMALSGMFNAVLLDHAEGLLFAWATALLYAGYTPAKAASEARTA